MANARNDGLGICNIVMGTENNSVLICSVLMSVRVGYRCVPKLSLEVGN